jgi:hypothetical protein
MQVLTVTIIKPEATNFILGQSHFIKSVEDLHEAMVGSVTPLGASALVLPVAFARTPSTAAYVVLGAGTPRGLFLPRRRYRLDRRVALL